MTEIQRNHVKKIQKNGERTTRIHNQSTQKIVNQNHAKKRAIQRRNSTQAGPSSNLKELSQLMKLQLLLKEKLKLYE